MESGEIINRVASSSLITLDLEELYQPGDRVVLDIKDQLYQGLILKEADFRNFVKLHDWAQYHDKYVAIWCSADAIVPTWAYMLLGVALKPFAKKVVFGDRDDLEVVLFQEKLNEINWDQYQDAKVVVKGCSKVSVPVQTYVEVAGRLQSVASSIMYGEPCSTVPLYKKPKTK